uniref:T-cell immunomodulatory protein TIP C2 domain-containing protein n=1 Tax=Piliocolobus tephrosceles TaxID=591936 RepID=A0A8C9GVU4_9PRIM
MLIEIWNSKKKEEQNESIAYVPGDESLYYTNIHPLVCDINNDGMPDMIAQVVTGDSNTVKRFLYINNKTGFKSILWDNMLHSFEYKEYKEISNPNSSAIVDIDGDCKADLVFTVYNNVVSGGNSKGVSNTNNEAVYLEIWLNKIINDKSVYINSNDYYKLPNNSLQVLFGDFNGDGSIDLVVPRCIKSSSCNYCCVSEDELYFIPNVQKKICDSTWKKVDETKCRPADKLCSESEYELIKNLNEQYVTTIDTNGLHLAGNADYPYYLSVGDVDNDGYLDLLIILKSGKGDKYVRIYKNERRSYNTEKNVEIREFFNYYDFITFNNAVVTDIYNAAFFDVYENGILDIIIFGKYQNVDKTTKYNAVSFIRNNETDSLFLKTTALNGICVRDCYKDKNKMNTKTFGNNAHGPTFKITVVDINGFKTSKIGTQKSQSAHLPLQLPYVIFGLSRTSNYVEEFYAGMPTHKKIILTCGFLLYQIHTLLLYLTHYIIQIIGKYNYLLVHQINSIQLFILLLFV